MGLGREAVMTGLVPKKRTSHELESANARLLEKHKEHLQSWVDEKRNAPKANVEKRTTGRETSNPAAVNRD
jgi:hypothetical protein